MFWYKGYINGEKSIIMVTQLYCDKQKRSVKVSELTFYTIHINMLNVLETMHNLMFSLAICELCGR